MTMKQRDVTKYMGTLLGCAIGDTLGMAVEGWKREQIVKYAGRITAPRNPVIVRDSSGNILKEDEFGKLKSWTRELKKGQYTDDTILTIALAEALADQPTFPFDLAFIARKQVEAYRRQPITENGKVVGAFGKTTQDAFKNFEKRGDPSLSGLSGIGLGPAMKMSPVGLWMDATGMYEPGLNAAMNIGFITHTDPSAVTAGIVQAHAVHALLHLEPDTYKIISLAEKRIFIESLVNVCSVHEHCLSETYPVTQEKTLLDGLEWVLENPDATAEEAYLKLGNSSRTIDGYPFAVFMFQKYWYSPLEGLVETVNFGGDCDTTGAIYGTLAGARNGLFMPAHWLNGLQNLNVLNTLAGQLFSVKKQMDAPVAGK